MFSCNIRGFLRTLVVHLSYGEWNMDEGREDITYSYLPQGEHMS